MTNIVDEDTIMKILPSDNPNDLIRILKWDIIRNIISAGGNYASEVSRLMVTYVKNGVEMKKSFFLKIPSNSLAFETFNNAQVYDKEIIMYTVVLPQMYAIDDEYFTPRNYLVGDKKSLVQKDLSVSGYKMLNKLDQLNLEQCVYALKCLAKLHGLSVKLEGSIGLPNIVKMNARCNPDRTRYQDDITCFYESIEGFANSLPNHITQTYPKQVAAFKRFTWEQYERAVVPRHSSFNVLNHGDFWTNNILFKFDKFDILKKVKLIDFQLCCWANPVIDLICFFITSVKFEVYEKYFELLLQVYLDTLNKVLGKLNCCGYSKEELVKDIDTRYVYTCFVIAYALPFTISDPLDPIEVDNSHLNRLAKIYRQQCYRDVAVKWFLHLIQKGVFDGEVGNQ